MLATTPPALALDVFCSQNILRGHYHYLHHYLTSIITSVLALLTKIFNFLKKFLASVEICRNLTTAN
jgi:hypothetical protein